MNIVSLRICNQVLSKHIYRQFQAFSPQNMNILGEGSIQTALSYSHFHIIKWMVICIFLRLFEIGWHPISFISCLNNFTFVNHILFVLGKHWKVPLINLFTGSTCFCMESCSYKELIGKPHEYMYQPMLLYITCL